MAKRRTLGLKDYESRLTQAKAKLEKATDKLARSMTRFLASRKKVAYYERVIYNAATLSKVAKVVRKVEKAKPPAPPKKEELAVANELLGKLSEAMKPHLTSGPKAAMKAMINRDAQQAKVKKLSKREQLALEAAERPW